MSDLFSGGLTQARLDVSIWRFRADQVPREDGAVREFLVENWKKIDHFVSQTALPEQPSQSLPDN